MSASRSSLRSAVACATSAEFSSAEVTLAALARQRREHGVAVDGELLQRLVLGGEDLEDLVDLLERRVGAADDLVEVLAAAGHAGAELGQDDREARLLRAGA